MNRSCFGVALSLFIAFAALGSPRAASAAPWLDVKESQGIVYFSFSGPARIERYDLAAQTWLSPLGLTEVPTAFAVDTANLFVSFGRRTSRFTLSGTGEAHLKNTPSNVQWLAVMGGQLILQAGETTFSINKQSGAEIDNEDFFYSIVGITAAPTQRKIFGRSAGISPSDILAMTLNPDGTFLSLEDSPYHGSYPSGSRTFLFPGESRVADDSGIVYNTSNLTYSNNLHGNFDDLAFYVDLPVVLRSGEVIAYSNGFAETGRFKPAKTPLKIFVRNGLVFSFYQGPSKVEAETFPVSLLTPAQPGEPVDPNGLAYTPDAVEVGKDGILYILSGANQSVFRWSIALRRYLETIPLVEAPSHMAYSAKTHHLYLAYPTNAIRQIDLAASTHETAFANSPQAPLGLATAGELVFLCDPSGAWATHYVFRPDGSLVDEVEWNYISEEYVWSEANRKMYFFRDDTSPNDILWEEIGADGTIGEEIDSPYHGEINTLHPIRVAPDGSVVVIGSGEIFNAQTLSRIDSLSNDVADAAWNAGTLFTLREIAGGTEIQKWGTSYGVAAHRAIAGTPVRLFGQGGQLVVVTSVAGVPHFSLWDNALNELSSQLEPLNLGGGRYSVTASWQKPDGTAGTAHGVALTADTGYFWFFSPSNVEVILKVLDGCGVNRRSWVFAGGLTNVQVEIVVTDNSSGEQRSYSNPQGQPFQPIQDTRAFGGCPAPLAAAADPGGVGERREKVGLPLNGSRFTVETSWLTGTGQSGAGQPAPLTADTGYFWFFSPSNVEAVVKVLDGCAVNGHYWVFAGGLTDVQTTLRVTDTATGAVKTYVNPQGTAFQPIQDVAAFACN